MSQLEVWVDTDTSTGWVERVARHVGTEWFEDPSPASFSMLLEVHLPTDDGTVAGEAAAAHALKLSDAMALIGERLEGVVWERVHQVVSVTATKTWCHRGNEGMRITLTEWGNRDDLSDAVAAYAAEISVLRGINPDLADEFWRGRSDLDPDELRSVTKCIKAHNAAHQPTTSN